MIISDSEVDEDGLWHARNLFIAGRKGGLVRTRRVKKATVEPEGIAWDARTRSSSATMTWTPSSGSSRAATV